jgi:predicted ABC-type transport system involved in lysophospholipase L1 biosynthesis ATPase subunit
MNGPGPALLRARGLRKDYGKGEGLVRAVDELDLEVDRGEALAVMGPSGCGKSTLLHLLGGLDRPSAGEVWLNGRRTDRLGDVGLAELPRREIGFVFQAYHLMDELAPFLVYETAALCQLAASSSLPNLIALVTGRLADLQQLGIVPELTGSLAAPLLAASQSQEMPLP